MSMLKRIGSMYNPVPYHNLTHGFDVMVVILNVARISIYT